MAIQPLMGATKASFWLLLAVLLTAAVSSNDRKESLDVYLSQLFDPMSGLLDEDTAEILWTSCRLDLIHLKEDIEDLDLCFPQEPTSSTNEINSETRSLAQKNIQKLISAHLPQLKQILLHCLRKNNLPILVTGEDNQPKNLHVPYFKSPFSRFNTPRGNLGLEFPQHISETSSRSPTPTSPTPLSCRRLSSDPSPASRNASRGRSLIAREESDTQSLIIAAVVITASVTFIVAALLFMICSKYFLGGGVRKNDERPLLSLSMSDYSVSSSHHSFTNSIKEEKLGFQTSSNSLLDDKNNSSLNGSFHIGSDVVHTTVQESQSIGDAGATVNPLIVLKPPSGRVVSNSTGLPPLKPPPGRLHLLPPEPPLRPSDAVVPPAASPAVPSSAPPPPPAPPQPKKPAPPPPAGPRPPPPPARPDAKTGPGAPPPPNTGPGPPRPPPPIRPKAGRPAANRRAVSNTESDFAEIGVPKTKLKPFFWDKVQASSESAVVWNQLKAGSFQFNEEMIESLFGYVNTAEKSKGEHKKELEAAPQFITLIDSKKSQNLSILLKALNVTMEEVCDALLEGNELPAEFIQTLLKMAPTQEEELKLRLYDGELCRLGPADRFLKALVDVPFAYKRLDTLFYMGTLQEDLNSTMESFAILEVACNELRSSRLFLKLLEAVLKTGNRMNDGTFRGGALAFKLDTLLKLSDVKGVDGKTTLLHFVVQEIIRSEGIRAARVAKESRSFSSIKTDDLLEDLPHESPEHYRELGLDVVSRLSRELENVKKAAALDADSLTGTTAKLGHGLVKTKEFLNTDLQNLDGDKGFIETVKSFVQSSEEDILKLLKEEKKIINLVKSTGDYFHGNSGKDEGLRLFVIVRDFLVMLDKVCREVRDAAEKKKAAAAKPVKQATARASSASELRPPLSPDIRQKLFAANSDNRRDDFSTSSSSDDDSL